MPGSGKSTVGRHLARLLGWSLADSDAEIEKRIGCPVREFFERKGEAAFRDLEAEVIERIVSRPEATIIATGGGAVLRESNRRALSEHTRVVYLRAAPEDLFRRLRRDTQRPLLQVRDPLNRLRELYRERDPLYRQTAHYVVETGRSTLPVQVNMILMQLELAGVIDPMQVPATVGR